MHRRFEYRVEKVPFDLLHNALNDMGDKGWRAVAIKFPDDPKAEVVVVLESESLS